MLLDIGVGILLAIGISKFFLLPLSAAFIVWGIVFALAPDADFIFHLMRGGSSRDSYRHRDLFHYPLIVTPIGTVLIALFSAPLAVLFGLATLAHFVHDSIGIGWGVQWLYPLTSDHYTFLYKYQPPDKPHYPRKFFYIWKDAELDRLNEEHGDPHWIRHIYLNWHPYAIIELFVFIVALIALYMSVR